MPLDEGGIFPYVRAVFTSFSSCMDNAFIATTFDWDHRTPKTWQMLVNKGLRKMRIPIKISPAPPSLANVESRMNLFHLLAQTIAYKVPGDVVELGCNAGDSTIVMQKMLKQLAPEKRLYAFDSFEGLPEITGSDLADGVYGKGFMAAPLELFKYKFKKLGLELPVVHKGWFQDTVPQGLPERISFALLDGDLYESTKHILPHVYERMSPGAIGMIAVYYDEAVFPRRGVSMGYKSPGVKRACDEFFGDKPEKVRVLYANEYSNGFFRKR